ncbi:MAG TPA: tetratricopeptide repeat protein [Myxococcales bacterium]|nr:tetratricopeptide repeat protein [Myxococcales bacterium]
MSCLAFLAWATAGAAADKAAPAATSPATPVLPPVAAVEPLPTTCGPETQAAKDAARMRAAEAATAAAAKKLGETKPQSSESEQAKDFFSVGDQYRQESLEYRNEIHLLVEKRFAERRSQLSDSYERAIRDRENVERTERQDAIAQFEEFLSRYPNDPQYSADASFRLAELHYEKSQDDYNVAMDAFQQKLRGFQAGTFKGEPQQPTFDFSPSIQLYRRMLATWPTYRFIDAVYYLLGYCDEQQGDQPGADQAFAELINRFPRSKFVPEAWLRQGEYYFDAVSGNPTEALKKAALAYQHVLDYPDQPLYDKAIYKLGWTYYRLDDYGDAVQAFVKLLDYYLQKSRGAAEKLGDMQNEALQYTAICFSDDKWGGVDKAESYFRSLGGRPYERDVYKRLGDIYYDETHTDLAVAAFKLALARAPLAPDAPLIQAKIVQAYARDRAFDKQTAERERLVSTYAEGTPWYAANHADADAVVAAKDIAERALRDAAIYHIEQAIAYKKDGKIDQAFTEYRTAASAFGEYLARYPHAKDVYELTYYYADALYNSLQFALSAREYQAVRDMTIDHQYEREAAHDAVLSWQNEIDRLLQAKQLPPKPVLKSTERKGIVPTPEAMPEVYASLVHASDAFVNLFPADALAPAVAYKAAETFYVFNEFDEARCRFRDIISRWPKNEVSQYAANLTIETYLANQDWANVTHATSELLSASGGVVQRGSELEQTLVKFQLAGIFKLAQQEMDAGHFEKAAKLFLELVQRNPQHEFADKALNNAAVCYEKSRRFDSALKIYERIVTEYPKSALADQALFRVASDAEQSYDFDKAVDRYQLLVDKYPNSKNRASALYDSARLLEGLQRYADAARAYRRYAELFPDEPDAPQNLFRAALVFEKMKDYGGAIKAFQEFDRKFDRDHAQAELVVQARLKMAECYEALHQERARNEALKDTVKTFDRLSLGSDKVLAADAAAEAQFDLLEQQFQAYDRLKIHGSKKVLARSFKDKTDTAKRLREAYMGLVRFKRPEWILAAFYRKANVLEHFANSIYDAPVPPEIKRYGDEAIGIYQDALAQKATALESQAVDDYIKTLEEARTLHIVNKWTKQTLESLNHYRPKEYPLLKDPRQELEFDVRSPAPLALSLSGIPAGGAEEGKLGGEDGK